MKINIKNKNKKSIIQVVFCICCICIILFVSVTGLFFAKAKFHNSAEFVETPNLIQHLEASGTRKEILVFYQEDCPYCEAGVTEIKAARKKTKFPVYYVNTQSQTGKILVKNFNIKYASTLTVIQSGKYRNVAYADKINGKYVPLKENIHKVFGVMNEAEKWLDEHID